MSRTYAVIFDEDGKLLDFDSLPANIAKAARIAVNAAAAKARTWSAQAVRKEVNLPARYVSPGEGRLTVATKASNSKLQAVVSARSRPTSLARFVQGSARAGQKGARIEVTPGAARYMPGAVFVKLRRGAATTDTAFNLGLAVRTKGNRKPDGAYKPIQMKNGMWLLYGPSVAQALLNARNSGIWPDMTDKITEYLEQEFRRVLELGDAVR